GPMAARRTDDLGQRRMPHTGRVDKGAGKREDGGLLNRSAGQGVLGRGGEGERGGQKMGDFETWPELWPKSLTFVVSSTQRRCDSGQTRVGRGADGYPSGMVR